jgi:hypothetical protein
MLYACLPPSAHMQLRRHHDSARSPARCLVRPLGSIRFSWKRTSVNGASASQAVSLSSSGVCSAKSAAPLPSQVPACIQSR